MPQTEQLLEGLKRAFRSKSLTYREIAKRLGVSEPTIKRHFATGNVTLRRLEELCDAAGMSFFELARLGRAGADDAPSQFTLAQEEALALDERLLALFYLLLQGWTPAQVVADYVIARRDVLKAMSELDALRLIEVHPGDHVRVKVSQDVRWRQDGPLAKAYEARARQEFLQGEFAGPGSAARFATGELSGLSARVVLRRLEKLSKEFYELAEVDAKLPKSETSSVALLIGFRPWVFSVFESLRRR